MIGHRKEIERTERLEKCRIRWFFVSLSRPSLFSSSYDCGVPRKKERKERVALPLLRGRRRISFQGRPKDSFHRKTK